MTDTKRHFRMGWDVGGWHCDHNNASRDALVVLELTKDGARRVGKSFRGNLRQELLDNRGVSIVREFLRKCDIDILGEFEVAIGIDTPLGWPNSFLSLVTGRDVYCGINFDDRSNPYTRRRTEVDIIERGFRRLLDDRPLSPLSSVTHQIGSQSTKGIHFLHAAGLSVASVGIFQRIDEQASITAFEAYPAVAQAARNAAFDHYFTSLRWDDEHSDIDDALRCAVVAHLYADQREEITDIPVDKALIDEGWIIYPRSCGK